MKKMKICVIGGGNIGTLIAGEMARNYDVRMLTSKPSQWENSIHIINKETEEEYDGMLEFVTDNAEQAIKDADIIYITVPSHIIQNKLKEIEPYVHRGAYVGVVPGTGGCEFYAKKLIEKGVILFGMQRVPYIVRLKRYGHEVYNLSTKKELNIACIPRNKTEEVCILNQKLFGIPCREVNNFLAVTLTPSNPILHTARLYSMFKNYKKGMVWEKEIGFYDEWSDDSSEMLILCDEELQNICRAYEKIDLSEVKSLKIHYESDTIQKMTQKICNIPSFQGIKTPMVKTEKGYIPDFDSRYFEEDFPYGLCIIKSFAEIAGIETKNIDKVLKWYERMKNVEFFVNDQFIGKDLKQLPLPINFGLHMKEQIYNFYLGDKAL